MSLRGGSVSSVPYGLEGKCMPLSHMDQEFPSKTCRQIAIAVLSLQPSVILPITSLNIAS